MIKKPWPSMTRGILNDWPKFIETYWSKYGEKIWYHGDLVRTDSEGFWYILGRADDLIKISGHRIGNAEVEEAIASHPSVSEVAVVGVPDQVRGEVIAAWIVLKDKAVRNANNQLIEEFRENVRSRIGGFAVPTQIKFVDDLPRTRSGKLMRRLIKSRFLRLSTSSLDFSVVENPESLNYI